MDAIVYTSNAGHTKAYAELLAEKTGLKAYDMESAGKELSKESKIIYMGWLMAGSIKGFKTAMQKYDIQAVCAVGMTTEGVESSLLAEKNHIPAGMKIFYLQGGFDIKKLRGVYRVMMNIMSAQVKKNLDRMPSLSAEETEMYDMMTYGMDKVDAANLTGVTDWLAEN